MPLYVIIITRAIATEHLTLRSESTIMTDLIHKQFWEDLDTLLSKQTEERDLKGIESIMVWFRNHCPICKNLEDDAMVDVIKHIKPHRYRRDSVILRQGEKGNCMYLVIKGSVSVYAKKDGEGDISQESTVRSLQERIVLFGTELSTLKVGRNFGESVMTDDRKVRNATIISDEATLLVSIDESLYQRSLLGHTLEWKRKIEFVNNCSLLASWPTSYKMLLVENLRSHKFNFGNMVVKQNTPCQGVFFIAKGTGKVLVEPRIAAKQYNRLKPRKKSKKSVFQEDDESQEYMDDTYKALTVIEKRRKRKIFGYIAEERRQRAQTIALAIIGQNDIIGDLELVLDLHSYTTGVECLESLECYELDKPNFHRLIVKRNPETLEKIKCVAIAKLKFREERLQHLPYYSWLLEQANQQGKGENLTRSKAARPKSVAKALAGFMALKKLPKGNDIFKRLQAPMASAYEKNVIAKSTSTTSQEGKQSESHDNQVDRRRDKKGKKQYTAEEFRTLKKKVQSTGKLIRRISD